MVTEELRHSWVLQTVAQARAGGISPRVHPNGFIQLDLSDDGSRVAGERLHVWPDDNAIPRQSVATTIHDHRFDMRSTVLKGTIIHRPYMVQLDPCMPWSHEIHIARYPYERKESVLAPTGVKVHVISRGGLKVLGEGESYEQPKYTFHDTQWVGLTATLMEKTGEDLGHEPRVLVPVGAKPDNGFVRAQTDKDLLWDYIERALTDGVNPGT